MAYHIKQMSPQLQVTNLDRSIQFYTEVLGFEVDFLYEDFYAGIVKDGYSIHLKITEHPVEMKPHDDDAPLEILFTVEGIDSIYNEFSARAEQFVQPLRQMPYGKEFYLADPDRNVISFVEPTND